MKKQITAYRLGGEPFEIRPAPHTRQWMDQTEKGYAYRCLPLVAANCYGWELLCPKPATVSWNGQNGLDAITIEPAHPWCLSHFGYGIVTFQIPFLFRTSADADLLISGPVNFCKKNIVPLEGIVETSWSTMTFTMNMKCTSDSIPVEFHAGEPICRIVPVPRNFVGYFVPTIIDYENTPLEITQEHRDWSDKRRSFLEALQNGDPDAVKKGWQKSYYKRAKVLKLPEFKEIILA